MNSRAKGCRGERALAEFLRSRGIGARRSQQFCGQAGDADITCDIPGVHFECKRVEAGNPYTWLDQAIRDCGDNMPIVAHKRNRREWIAVLRLSDLMELMHSKN